MSAFWKRHNPRTAKMLEKAGVPESWQARDWVLQIEGVDDVTSVAASLRSEFEEAHLGAVETRGDNIWCTTHRSGAHWAMVLVRETLQKLGVSDGALIRSGFPKPTVAARVHKISAQSNLQKIGKASREKLRSGDVFAYSFDKARYYWGIVVRDNVTAVASFPALLVYLFNESTTALTPPSAFRSSQLIGPPMFIDDSCWKRGLFVTVGNFGLQEIQLLEHCFEVKGYLPGSEPTYVDENGHPRERGPVCGSWGVVSHWTSVDAELSRIHGVPLLA